MANKTVGYTDFYRHSLKKSPGRLSLRTLREVEEVPDKSSWHSTAGKQDAFTAFVSDDEAYGFCCYSGGSATVHRLFPDQIKVAKWLCETEGDGEVYLRGDGTEFAGRVKTANASWSSHYIRTGGKQFQTVRLRVDCMLESEHITLPVKWAIFGDEVLRVSYYEAGSDMGFTNRPRGPYLSMTLEFDLPDEFVNKTSLVLDDVLASGV